MATVIKRKNSPNWYLRFMIDGKVFYESSGTTNKKQALRLLKQTVEDLRVKHKSKELTEAVFEKLTGRVRAKLAIDKAWEAWNDSPRKRNPGESTVSRYRTHWKQFSDWLSKNDTSVKYLHDVTPLIAERYATHLWKSGISPNTYNKNQAFLHMIFEVLATQGGIANNPWQRIETMPLETKSRRAFTSDELQTICERATGFVRYATAIGLYTGMRLGDVCTLKWNEIDFDKGMISHVARKTRNKGKELQIPLHPVLASVLGEMERKRGPEYLFPKEAEAYLKDETKITRKYQAFLEECSIKTTEEPTGQRKNRIVLVGFHSLRHSFVSLCAANNVAQVAIMDLVGHGSPAMTRLYSHAGNEEKVKAIAALPTLSFSEDGDDRTKPNQHHAGPNKG